MWVKMISRCAWVWLLGGWVCLALAAPPWPVVERITGGPVDPSGQGMPGYLRLVAPGALAARASEVYIADPGVGGVLRYDRASGRMARILEARDGMQLALGLDFSLYVLDPAGRRVLRYTRGGSLVQQYADHINLAHPVDFALDEGRGWLWVLDGQFGQIVGFNPFGRLTRVIPLVAAGFPPGVAVALARGPVGFYVADRARGRVAVLDESGQWLYDLGSGALGQPAALAVDGQGRVFVVDRRDRSVKRIWPEPVRDSGVAERYGQLGDLATDEFSLLVSDPLGGVVEALRADPEGR